MKDMMNIKIIKVFSGDHIDSAVPCLVDLLKPGKPADLRIGNIREISENNVSHYLFPVFVKILNRSDFAL